MTAGSLPCVGPMGDRTPRRPLVLVYLAVRTIEHVVAACEITNSLVTKCEKNQ